MAIPRIKRTKDIPDTYHFFNIQLPLYVKQEFLGPYGLGTIHSFRKIDITDLEFLLNKRIVYRITQEPVQLFVKLQKDIKTEKGKTVRYMSVVSENGFASTQTHIKIVNTIKI